MVTSLVLQDINSEHNPEIQNEISKNVTIMDSFSYLHIDWIAVWLSHAIKKRYLHMINGYVLADHGAN